MLSFLPGVRRIVEAAPSDAVTAAARCGARTTGHAASATTTCLALWPDSPPCVNLATRGSASPSPVASAYQAMTATMGKPRARGP